MMLKADHGADSVRTEWAETEEAQEDASSLGVPAEAGVTTSARVEDAKRRRELQMPRRRDDG